MGSTVKIAFVTLIILAVIFVVHVLVQQFDSEKFESIEKGALKEDVVAALGEPDVIRACADSLYWGGDESRLGPNHGQCVEEYYYSSMPGGWSIGFSNSGQAVSKYVHISP